MIDLHAINAAAFERISLLKAPIVAETPTPDATHPFVTVEERLKHALEGS